MYLLRLLGLDWSGLVWSGLWGRTGADDDNDDSEMPKPLNEEECDERPLRGFEADL
jgi:hypothetical protein